VARPNPRVLLKGVNAQCQPPLLQDSARSQLPVFPLLRVEEATQVRGCMLEGKVTYVTSKTRYRRFSCRV